MEEFLLNTTDYQRLYNCSFYDVGTLPLAKRQRLILGAALAGISLIEELLYIPCLVAIWRLSKDSACYKMMFVMGVLDMLCLPICGIATGIMGIMGTVYCSWPGPIHVLGAIAFGLWIAESTVEIILSFNRCLELLVSEHTVQRLFGGWRTWFLMALAITYGLYVAVFQKPVLFSSFYFAWFFNPHIGYVAEGPAGNEYHCPLHSGHNIALLVVLTGTYLFMGLALAYKIHFTMTTGSNQSLEIFARHKMIFIQVVIISVINGMAASIYDYMQFFPTPPWLTIVSQFCWSQAHGFPVVIYLSMNPTIRAECRKLFIQLRSFNVKCVRVNAGGVHPNPSLFSHQQHAKMPYIIRAITQSRLQTIT